MAQGWELEEKYHEEALSIYVEFFVLSCIVIGLYMFCPTIQYSPPKNCNLASRSYSAQGRHSVMNQSKYSNQKIKEKKKLLKLYLKGKKHISFSKKIIP